MISRNISIAVVAVSNGKADMSFATARIVHKYWRTIPLKTVVKNI